jgi:hypothetical protein
MMLNIKKFHIVYECYTFTSITNTFCYIIITFFNKENIKK